MEPNHPLNLENAVSVKQQMSGFIFLGLDKNYGKTAIVCPVKMHQILKKTFLDDKIRYTSTALSDHITEEEIVNGWKKAYDGHKWHSVAPLCTYGSVPYSYVIPKFKDLSRNRPIISYRTHPLRKVFKVALRALVFLVKSISVKTFTLHRTQDLLSRLKDIECDLGDNYEQNTEFLEFSVDVKEMFTQLPHKEIRLATKFVIDVTKKLTRSNYVRVPKFRKECAFGKSSNKNDVLQISTDQIFELVCYDVRSAIFRVGKHIMKQSNGAPIGGVLSTAEAWWFVSGQKASS
jgi:hypothetical protein